MNMNKTRNRNKKEKRKVSGVMRAALRTKRPKNKAEGKLHDLLSDLGWTAQKRGWPDFFCYNKATGEIILVEVKPRASHNLKPSQAFIMQKLSEYGVPCFRWDPEGGLRKLKGGIWKKRKKSK